MKNGHSIILIFKQAAIYCQWPSEISLKKKRSSQCRLLRALISTFSFLFLAFAFTNLSAEENHWQDSLTVNGFYTLDLTYSDRVIPVISNGNVERLLEADDSTLKNSIFGLQVEYEFTEALSVFLQGAALYDRQDESDLSLDWAYFNYDLGNDYSLRLGQFLVPFLQGTELKSIGYSRLWARPLVPGSGAGGFTDYTGVELIKRVLLENSNLNIQIALGEPEHDLDQIDARFMGLMAATYEARNYWIRAALLRVDYEISTPRGAVIDSDAQVLMASIEAEIRHQEIIINAGLSNTKADITPDDSLAYLSVGYQAGNYTPYILGKVTRRHFDTFTVPVESPPGPPPPGPPPPSPPPPPDGDRDTTSLAIGFRFDLGDNYAIKSQWQHIKTEDDSRATDGTAVQSGNVFSILIEGVF